MPRHTEKERKKNKKKVTSKDMPGSGLAKKAAQSIEKRIRDRKKFLDSL